MNAATTPTGYPRLLTRPGDPVRTLVAWLLPARFPICVIIAPLAMLLTATRAQGLGLGQATFAPISCAPCPFVTTVPNFSYGAIREHKSDRYGGGGCLENVDFDTHIWANQYVKKFEFNFASFDMELDYDFIRLADSATSSFSKLTGSQTPNTWWGRSSSGTLQTRPLPFNYRTDYSVESAGFASNSARVCCTGSQGSLPEIVKSAPTKEMGVLLGTNDVVYLKFGAPSSRYSVVQFILTGPREGLDFGQTPSFTDFDLYVQCNGTPTPFSYRTRGVRYGSHEYVSFIPSSSSCRAPNTYTVAVHSALGAGRFDLYYGVAKDAHTRNVKVGIPFNASGAQLQEFAAVWKRAFGHYFGATEGMAGLYSIHIYNNAGSRCRDNKNPGTYCDGVPCDACMSKEIGRSDSWITIRQEDWDNPNVIAHEMLHAFMGLNDEYHTDEWQNDYARCGHSMMADGHPNLCLASDHERDSEPIPFPVEPIGRPPVWPKLYNDGRVYGIPRSTPDAYDFATFNFGDQFPVTIH